MDERLGRWHKIFADVLEGRSAVAVQVVLEEHLGRPASRSEANAARRAAHSFAARGRARIESASVTPGGQRDRLVLMRPEVQATPDLLAAALVAGRAQGTPASPRGVQTGAARRLIETLREAAAQSRHVETGELDPVDAAALEASLAAALADLAVFRRRLLRSARRGRAASRTSNQPLTRA